ncbi:MAG TPA: DUF92 domain-containing protein [Chitinophagaceae bacterium]
MAFNWKTFRTRTLTAAVFVLVMAAGLFVNQWSFLLLFSLIHFGCWVEYVRLVRRIDPGYKNAGAVIPAIAMTGGWTLMLWMCSPAFFTICGIHVNVLGGWPLLTALVLLLIAGFVKPANHLKNFSHSCFGLLYISLPLALMMDLYGKGFDHPVPFPFEQSEVAVRYPVLALMVIFSLWISDTMAYIVGSLMGKHPLSSISPKKTWEGTAGGIILAAVVMGFLGYVVLGDAADATIISLIAAIAGTFGDLLESKLKRLAQVKDSGTIMPGHGGFLDRFDSLLLATPFVWLYVAFAMR